MFQSFGKGTSHVLSVKVRIFCRYWKTTLAYIFAPFLLRFLTLGKLLILFVPLSSHL